MCVCGCICVRGARSSRDRGVVEEVSGWWVVGGGYWVVGCGCCVLGGGIRAGDVIGNGVGVSADVGAYVVGV